MMKTTAMLGSIVLAHAMFSVSLGAAPQTERRAPSDADRAPLQMEVVRSPDRVAFRVRLDDDTAGAWVAILISGSERTAPLDADRAPRILDTDTILASGRAIAGCFHADCAFPGADRVPATHTVYAQPVTVDRDGAIHVGAVTHVGAHAGGGPVDGDVVDGDVVDRDGDGYLDAAARPLDRDGDGYPDDDSTGGAILDRTAAGYDGPPMDAWFSDGRTIGVEFTVPSNDYALYWDFNRPSELGVDVFLFLEEPGEGEGLLDVVEFHRMAIPVSRDGGNLIRVFVARARRTGHDLSTVIRDYRLAKVLRRP